MGCKPYHDAPCVVCGKIVHPYAKGMCRSCYSRFKNYGALTPPRPAVIPIGTTRYGWTRRPMNSYSAESLEDWNSRCGDCIVRFVEYKGEA